MRWRLRFWFAGPGAEGTDRARADSERLDLRKRIRTCYLCWCRVCPDVRSFSRGRLAMLPKTVHTGV